MALTPIAGKLGRVETVVSAATVDHEFEDWVLGLEADIVDTDGFEKTADGDGNYWRQHIAGLCGGDWSLEGQWNTTKRPTTSFKVGNIPTTLSLGLNLGTVFFTLPTIFKSIGASTNVYKSARFKAAGVVNGAPTYPSA